MENSAVALETIQGLGEILRVLKIQRTDELTIGELYCSHCGGNRRMKVKLLFASKKYTDLLPISVPNTDAGVQSGPSSRATDKAAKKSADKMSPEEILKTACPALVIYTCVQCDAIFTVIAYEGTENLAIAILPNSYGGYKTPHTPDGVAYYLDQAHRSQSIGAYSAAVAMYRAALEHLLFEQGYKSGMLGAKIQKLKNRHSPKFCSKVGW